MATIAPVVEVSTQEVFEVLSRACSQVPAESQQATEALKHLSTQFGTYNGLIEIACQREGVDTVVRKMAVIQFKNIALSHWRSRKLMSDEHRVQIRMRCMSFIYEQDDPIAEVSKVIIAGIARYDYPANWPTLITDLMTVIGTNLSARYSNPSVADPATAMILRRSLRILLEILKKFADIKMMAGMKTMSSIIELLHLELYQHWSNLTQFLGQLSPQTINSLRIAEDLMLTHMVFKCIVKQAHWLMGRADRTGREEFKVKLPWFREVFSTASGQVQSLMRLRRNLIEANPPRDDVGKLVLEQLTKHVRTYGKFFRTLQKTSAEQFVALPGCDVLIMFYWTEVITESTKYPRRNEENDDDPSVTLFPLRYVIQGMELLKNSLSQWAPEKKNGTANSITLPEAFVTTAVDLLVEKFLPFHKKDEEAWQDDPEQWALDEARDDEQFEYAPRACAERVLMILCNRYASVAPQIYDKFVDLQHGADITYREAVYCAVGRCAGKLKESILMDVWMDKSLIQEAQLEGPKSKPLKRRIAWLMGRWIYDQCSPPTQKMWGLLVYLLSDLGPSSDVAVRLGAATAVRECVDSVEFSLETFTPFLPQIIPSLIRLLAEVKELDTKRQVARAINTVIERAEQQIVPFIGVITGSIPQLWATSGDNWSFKATLLEMVTALVNATKDHSAVIHQIVVPLVQESLAPGEASVNLDNEATTMWVAALHNANAIQSIDGGKGLIELFPIAIELLSTNLDLLGKIDGIVESYLLLDAPLILQHFSLQLFQAFVTALKGSAITLNTRDILRTLSLLVQITPSGMWGAAFHNSGLFALLLTNLTDVDSGVTAHILTEHIYLFSRILVTDGGIFLTLMNEMSKTTGAPEPPVWDALMDQWWRKFDNISESKYRKLTAMGTACLVATLRPEVLKRLSGDIFNIWTDVFAEIGTMARNSDEEGDDNEGSLNTAWELEDAPSEYYADTEGTVEYQRRKLAFEQDPVRTNKLNEYIRGLLTASANAYSGGGATAFQAQFIENGDESVWVLLQKSLYATNFKA